MFYSLPAKAHYPPQPGRIECGAIVGGVFYSEYYSPEGGGTPAVNGACSWVKQQGKSCGTYRYGGTNYTLYNYKYVCNVPLDNQVYVIAIGLTVFAFLRKRVFFTFS